MGSLFSNGLFNSGKSSGLPQEPDFVSELKLAEAEDRLRRNISEVLAAHDRELPEASSVTEFAVAATVETVELIIVCSGRRRSHLTFEQRFVVGLFAFLIAHELGRRTLADLGVVLAAAALELFTTDEIADIYRLGASYRRLREQKKMHRFLHQSISEWFNDPSEERLQGLVEIFDLCCTPN
ncbi:hypothetical protein [Labrenzia sp. CE80]|uniref:hypothetical protein n=1 Tax=Labrenzia sp. CE80 TaxID=1788986 RepID=UPI00129A1EB7|nr:hypothetical protein [Labrenzia sp. CE80]